MIGWISFLICLTIVICVLTAESYFSNVAKFKHEEELNKIKHDSEFEFVQTELNRYIKMYNELKNEQEMIYSHN